MVSKSIDLIDLWSIQTSEGTYYIGQNYCKFRSTYLASLIQKYAKRTPWAGFKYV